MSFKIGVPLISNRSSQITVGLSPFQKKLFYLLQWRPFKIDENCFLFHVKISFRSKFLSYPFGHIKKNGLLRKIRLISKFMTSQPTITIHILSNISRNKGKQTLKFGQLIAYKINIFLRKSCRKWRKETGSWPLLVFQKSFIWGKSKWSAVF